MNSKLIPVILINGIFLYSIIFLGNDAWTTINLILTSIIIFAISRFIIRISQSEKNTTSGNLSERGRAITEVILVVGGLLTLLLAIWSMNMDSPNIETVWTKNIWVIICMILSELIYLFNHFKKQGDKDYTFQQSYIRIFAMLGIFYISAIIITFVKVFIRIQYSTVTWVAIVCVLGNAFIEYWLIKRSEIRS